MPGERDPRYDKVALGPEMFGNYDERFEVGLRVLVAGIEAIAHPSADLVRARARRATRRSVGLRGMKAS